MRSDAPRPRVVISCSVETPWNPATTQTFPSASAARTRSPLHLQDLGLAVDVVGDDPDLAAGEGHRVDPEVGQGHAQQRHALALADGEQHVHLAAGQRGRDGVGQGDEVVRLLAHGRHDDHEVVALAAGEGDVLGHGLDPVGVGDRGATELLDDQGHGWHTVARTVRATASGRSGRS